jgi:lipopolysaccharide transport system permease protein
VCLVLARRSIKVQYRQSLVGVGWVVLQPLLLAAVFTAFFSILARDAGGVPFPVFFLCGLFIWQFVAGTLGEGSASITANSTLISRVYLPRVYHPVAVVLANLVDLVFTGVALLVVMTLFQLTPQPTVVVLPLLIAIAIAAALGMALWLSSLSVAYRDIAVLLPVMTQLWFFATPVLYSVDVVSPDFLGLYYLNPMALVVTGARWAILGLAPPPPEAWFLGIGVALVLLASGYLTFRHREPTFADLI